jgi:2-C-methyl-D-erythritol 4-phosphate cytidylyltransferase
VGHPDAAGVPRRDPDEGARLGGTIQIVEAPAGNFKITHPEDLARAEALLC